MTDSKNTITLTPTMGHSVVDFKKDSENYLLLTVKGNEVEEQKRSNISVVALLDVSSSMSPDYKIGYLKKSMSILIDNLKKGDKLAIVAYSSGASTVLPITDMTDENKKKADSIISALMANGMTNMSAALASGYSEFNKEHLGEGVNRIILFTDGCPTTGSTSAHALAQLAGNCPAGVQVTTMGYGKPTESTGSGELLYGMGGELNVQLLQAMADTGKGNYYYMSDPDTCARAFATELGGLLTVVAQNVTMTVKPTDNRMKITEVLDDVDVTEKDGNAIITIPDVLAGETRYILLKTETLKQDKKWVRPSTVVEVETLYTDTITGKAETITTTAKVTFTDEDFDPLHPDVATQIEILNTIKAQAKADDFAARGDYASAVSVMSAVADDLEATGTDRGMKFSTGVKDLSDNYKNKQVFTLSANRRSSSTYSLKKGRGSGSHFDGFLNTDAQKSMQDVFGDGLSKDTGIVNDNPVMNDPDNVLPKVDPTIPMPPVKPAKPSKPENKGFGKVSSRSSW